MILKTFKYSKSASLGCQARSISSIIVKYDKKAFQYLKHATICLNKFCSLQKFLDKPAFFDSVCGQRHLSSNELSNVLRPFFFSVHPDLFGRFPEARATNEESIKILNAYLDTLIQRPGHLRTQQAPLALTFFLRNRDAIGLEPKIFEISVQFKGGDVKTELRSLLKACKLSTKYLEGLAPTAPVPPPPLNTTHTEAYYERTVYSTPDGRIREDQIPLWKRAYKKPDLSLSTWLEENGDKAKLYQSESQPIREEIVRVKERLRQFGLGEIIWAAEWNRTQCLGSFRSLERLLSETPDLRAHLAGRWINFSGRTGINIHGKILLSPKDVPQNWAKALQNYNTNDTIIKRHIPRMEAHLSSLLSDIAVVHRRNQEEMLAEDYHRQLQKIISILENYYAKGWPRPKESYDDLQFVVEGDSAPLTLSNAGQFLSPAVAPASILLPFIESNQERAVQRLISQSFHRKQMEEEVKRCKRLYSLESLVKDDSVEYEQMTTCCRRLCSAFHQIYVHLPVGSRIVVTSYSSVQASGEICIPWNWKEKGAQ